MKRTMAFTLGMFLTLPGSPARAEVTFSEQIAPLIHQNCTNCHRPEQVGPFSLISYRDVAKRAETIQGVIEQGYMPPWKPVGGHVDYANERRLTKDQIEMFAHWVEAGKPEGDPSKMPPMPEFPSGWGLGEPDLIVKMDKGFKIRASGKDIYRSFVFPIDLPEDKWVKAVELRPTAKGAMHHALFFLDTTGAGRKRDGTDGQPGFKGMVPISGGLGGYVPGTVPDRLPEDLAIPLPKGADVIMQTHFHPSGKEEIEQAELALYFADKPPSKTLFGVQVPPRFGLGKLGVIRAGNSAHTIEDSFTIPVDAQAWTIGGHAHYICTTMNMTAELPDGSKKILLDIDDWDLDWQGRYTFKEPIDLPAGTVLRSVLVYDNSTENPSNPFSPPRNIRWGQQSTDEMGSITITLTAKSKSDEAKLARSTRGFGSPLGGSQSRGPLGDGGSGGGRQLDPALIMRLLDKNRDGKLQKSELPQRLQSIFDTLDTNGDGAIDLDELKAARERFRR